MRIALQFALTTASMLLAASSSLADSVSFTGPISPYYIDQHYDLPHLYVRPNNLRRMGYGRVQFSLGLWRAGAQVHRLLREHAGCLKCGEHKLGRVRTPRPCRTIHIERHFHRHELVRHPTSPR